MSNHIECELTEYFRGNVSVDYIYLDNGENRVDVYVVNYKGLSYTVCLNDNQLESCLAGDESNTYLKFNDEQELDVWLETVDVKTIEVMQNRPEQQTENK